MSYAIENRGPLDMMMKAAVDSAVHEAIGRFRQELGDQQGLVHGIAETAAHNAVERFRSMCNGQLRLIELDHKQRLDIAMLNPVRPIFLDKDTLKS